MYCIFGQKKRTRKFFEFVPSDNFRQKLYTDDQIIVFFVQFTDCVYGP